jgi:O-antigen/teichoic acid export membrane protein
VKRTLFDLGTQMLPLCVTLVERILLTSLLLRSWGVERFEHWSVVVAAVAMLTIADLGCQISFSNRMALHMAEGDTPAAVRVYRESNAIFGLIAAMIFLVGLMIAAVPPAQAAIGLQTAGDHDRLVIVALTLAVAIKMVASNIVGVYRCNLAVARGTALGSAVELARVLLISAAVLGGYGLSGAAVATALATGAGYLIVVPLDIARRFPAFRYRVDRPTPFTTRGQLRLGLLYSLPFVPTFIMVQIPVIVIGAAGAVTGALASFVLLRTLSNFVRQLMQCFTYILGMELARLSAEGKADLCRKTYRLAGRFLACLLGLTCGGLLGVGQELVAFWSGKSNLYDPLLLGVMLLPLIATPTAQLASQMLTYASRPGPLATAIVSHAIVALALARFLPVPDIALRLTIAIYASEAVPFALILIRAVHGPLTLSAVLDEAICSLLAIVGFAVTFAVITVARPLVASPFVLGWLALFLGIALVLGLLAFKPAYRRWRAMLSNLRS